MERQTWDRAFQVMKNSSAFSIMANHDGGIAQGICEDNNPLALAEVLDPAAGASVASDSSQ